MARGWLVIGTIGLVATVAIACGSDEDDGPPRDLTNGDGGTADASNDAPAVDAALSCPLLDSQRSEVRGRVTILDGSDKPPPAPGARVCIHGRPELPCADALADGTYEHTCVPAGDVALLFSHDVGRVLWLRVFVPGLAQPLDTPIATRAENVKLFASVGVAYPQAGKGILTVNDSLDSMNGGVTVVLPKGSVGPFYSSDGIKITSDAGPSTGSGVSFGLINAGESRIGLVGANDGCAQFSGGWDSVDGGITVPVLEDTETRVLVTCP